jgi:hypothetical protein
VSDGGRTYRPTIAVDFDGCIHSYERGWQGGEIYGTVVPGFFEWVFDAGYAFHVVIHSSRATRPGHVPVMRSWLQEHYAAWRAIQPEPRRYPYHLGLEIVAAKPPAWITVDDRCIRFDGHWDELALRPDALLAFKPWTIRDQGGGEAT